MMKLFDASFKATCDLKHSVSVLAVHEWCVGNGVDRSELNEALEKRCAPLQPYNIPAIVVQPWHGGFYYGVAPLESGADHVSPFGMSVSEDGYAMLKIPPASWDAVLKSQLKPVKVQLAQKQGTKSSGTSEQILAGLKDHFDKVEKEYQSDDKETLRNLCKDLGYTDLGHLYKYELVNTLLVHAIQNPEDAGTKQKKTSASSGYFVFAKHVRSEVIKDNPLFSAVEIQKDIGVRWHKLSQQEKDVFKARLEEGATYAVPVQAVPVQIPVQAVAVAEPKKAAVPKKVKTDVWNTYIGATIPAHKCLCCKKTTITNTDFHVGHKKSAFDGGELNIDNLRPICAACNGSMGTMNMDEYIVKFGYFT
jgi:hypothetical protein